MPKRRWTDYVGENICETELSEGGTTNRMETKEKIENSDPWKHVTKELKEEKDKEAQHYFCVSWKI